MATTNVFFSYRIYKSIIHTKSIHDIYGSPPSHYPLKIILVPPEKMNPPNPDLPELEPGQTNGTH